MTDPEMNTEDSLEPGTESDGDEKRGVRYLLNSPAYMTSVMRRQVLQEMVRIMPEHVQRRVNALKNIQVSCLQMEAKFYEEVYDLERKYQNMYQTLYDKRKDIITGEYEPKEKETEWTVPPPEDEEEMSEKMKEISIEIKKSLKNRYADDVKGIPDFWLLVFRSTELLSDMIQDHDEPAFKKLKDIKIVYADKPMSYTLEFHFEPNTYFSDTVLTKQYFLKSKVDDEDPFEFEGPEIHKCTGCVINWHKGMNLTVKTIRKKQKHKARGAVRTVVKQVPNDSFFNFFNPPTMSEDESKLDIETQTILATDFEIGHCLRGRIIPKAVLYLTGDAVEDDDDDDDDDLEEEEDDEDEEEESDDEDGGEAPTNNKKKNANPSECQQQ